MMLQMTEPPQVLHPSSAEVSGQLPGHELSGPPSRRMGIAHDGDQAGALDEDYPGAIQTWCPAHLPLLAITCSTNEPLPRIMQWIRYHQLLGFSLFYFFVEGHAQDPDVVDALRALVGVKVSIAELACVVRSI